MRCVSLRAPFVQLAFNAPQIGIGGLGHLALQFGKAFGSEVTAFSSSPEKEKEAREFGADHFYVSTDPKQLAKAECSVDFLLTTANVNLDWAAFLKVLKPKGTLTVVGVPNEPMQIPGASLIVGEKVIRGSVIGGRDNISEMLTFAAQNNIKAKTEVVGMADCNKAVERVRQNEARYRMVLQN